MNLIGGLLPITGLSSIFSITTPISLGLDIASLSTLSNVLDKIKSYNPKSFSIFPSVGLGAFSSLSDISLTDPVYNTGQIPVLPNVDTSIINVPLVIPGEEMELAKLMTMIQKAILLKAQEYMTQAQISQLRQQAKGLNESISARKKAIEELNQGIAELDKAIGELKSEITKLEAAVKLNPQLAATVASLKAKLAELRQQRAELVRQRRAQERLLRQEERALGHVNRRISKLRATLTRLSSKIRELESAIARLERKLKTDDLNPALKKLISEVKRALRAKFA